MAYQNGVQTPQVDNRKRGLANCILNVYAPDEVESQNGYKANKNHVSNRKDYKNLKEYMTEVAKELGQRRSFYTLNFADVIWKVQNWKKLLPRVEMFYAVKANSDPVLLRLLVLMGLSFDCATEGEIQIVLDAGATPNHILWAHPVKPLEGLMYARKKGVYRMTVDGLDELDKIHRVFPNAKLLLRIQPSAVKCKYDLSSKFGCLVSEVPDFLKRALDLGMDVEGISFHVGGLCTDPNSYSSTIMECSRIFESARKMGIRFSVLDIGGGFIGASNTEDIFYQTTKAINRSLEDYFPDNTEVQVIAEPGCYVVGSAMHLICTVIGKRTVSTEEGRILRHYFLNNGIYGSFFSDIECYGIRMKPLLDESQIRSRSKHEAILFGQTCCSEDIIQKKSYHIVPDLDVGECLIWENMGAYTNTLCSTFCGVPLPYTTYVFIQSPQLDMESISNRENIRHFMNKNVAYVGSADDFCQFKTNFSGIPITDPY